MKDGQQVEVVEELGQDVLDTVAKHGMVERPNLGLASQFAVVTEAKKPAKQMQVAWDDMVPSANNPRTKENYDLPGMVASYKTHSFWPDRTLMVHKEADGKFRIVRGHRRYYGAQALQSQEPIEYARVFPTGKVPALVYEGLSEADITLLMMDHTSDGDRLKLDPWSECLAVAGLLAVNHGTEAEIAAHLGLFTNDAKTGQRVANRSYIQPRVQLFKLPPYIREAMEKYCRTKEGLIRWGMIPKLYKIWRGEFADHPTGDGPLLKAEFEKLTQPKDAPTKATVPLNDSRAATLISGCTSDVTRNLVASLIKNDGNASFHTLDTRVAQLEAAGAALEAVCWKFSIAVTDLPGIVAEFKAQQPQEEVPCEAPSDSTNVTVE